MDYIDLMVHAYIVLILFIAYLSLRRASHAQSHPQREESQEVKEFVASSPQLKQVLDDVERANDISDNSLQLLVNLKEQQQDLKKEVDEASSNITRLEHSLNAIAESTQNLDRVITGAQPKGALGEQIIGRNLSQLPQEWVLRNVRFRNDTHVEFCVRSPDGRLIPIDSKWAGTRLLDLLGQTSDRAERGRLVRAIQKEVWGRGLEVRKYLDDYRTIGFCIVTVPDAVFALCLDVQPILIKRNIVLISYSLLVPYILLLVKLFLSNAQAMQATQISHIISSSIIQIEQIQEFIDTDLRSPLDTVKQRQTEYRSQNERLQAVYNKLMQIQIELNVVKSLLPPGIHPLSNSEIASIPDELKHRLDQLRKSLIDSTAKQKGHVPDDAK